MMKKIRLIGLALLLTLTLLWGLMACTPAGNEQPGATDADATGAVTTGAADGDTTSPEEATEPVTGEVTEADLSKPAEYYGK